MAVTFPNCGTGIIFINFLTWSVPIFAPTPQQTGWREPRGLGFGCFVMDDGKILVSLGMKKKKSMPARGLREITVAQRRQAQQCNRNPGHYNNSAATHMTQGTAHRLPLPFPRLPCLRNGRNFFKLWDRNHFHQLLEMMVVADADRNGVEAGGRFRFIPTNCRCSHRGADLRFLEME